jgi:chemotaxis protein CheY-P-specific phosphatase CheC
MINEKPNDAEQVFKSAFEAGFVNASNSLSQLSRDKISFTSFHYGRCSLEHHYLDDQLYNVHKKGANILLTTEIFGDFTGKSYLFLSEAEFQLLTAGIPDGHQSGANLKEEFIKEVDNILAAAVITKLANELKRKMFGDVPQLIGKVNSKFEDTIYDDFIEQTNEIYINAAVFSFEKHPTVKPLFIWVIDSSVLQQLAA